ncbi:hypothetical protein GHT06_010698 [Daphnia sinensis]|uniref:Uncharacterized protein n=1 Tax=Daphnia sinensis TaxID=1820382 RepID=A0AAD5LJN4_9CRUS|nr:hypothetical protein GHT06_010698 [Daphnia sinensis]
MLSLPSHSRQKSCNIVKRSQSTKLNSIQSSNHLRFLIFFFPLPHAVSLVLRLRANYRYSRISGWHAFHAIRRSPQWVEHSKRYTSKHEAGSTAMEPEMSKKEMS